MKPKFSSEVDLEEGSRDQYFVTKMTTNGALHKFKIFDIRGSSAYGAYGFYGYQAFCR